MQPNGQTGPLTLITQRELHKRQPLRRMAMGTKRNRCEEEIYTRPSASEQPYGTMEGVAISASRLPGAGRSLFIVKPSEGNPLLIQKTHEFVCIHATMNDAITVEEAQTSESAYIWTKSTQLNLE